MHSLDANLKQLKLAPIKSHPTNKSGPVNETRAQTNIIRPFLFQDVYLKARDVSGGLWESLTDLKRNSCLARLSPSIGGVSLLTSI